MPAPVCERHGPKKLYRNGKGRETYRCTPCRVEYNRANGYVSEKRERVYPQRPEEPPTCERHGEEMFQYGSRRLCRCRSCKNEQSRASYLKRKAEQRAELRRRAMNEYRRKEIRRELYRRGWRPRTNPELLADATRRR
jgi:hypothetical protein